MAFLRRLDRATVGAFIGAIALGLSIFAIYRDAQIAEDLAYNAARFARGNCLAQRDANEQAERRNGRLTTLFGDRAALVDRVAEKGTAGAGDVAALDRDIAAEFLDAQLVNQRTLRRLGECKPGVRRPMK